MRLIIAPLLALLLALNMAGCASGGKAQQVPADSNRANADSTGENPYTASFVSRDRPTVALQPDPAGPKLYRGDRETEDYQRMLESGYDMLGYSSFEAADVPPDQALEHARKIKADLVLVYTKLSGSVPASVQIEKLRQARKPDGQSADAQSAGVKQAEASSGQLLPQEQARYSYFSSYWVKLAPPLIGVHVTRPDEGDGATGLKVIAVVNQSPAAKAGIQDGDVLIRIGDVDLDKPEALQLAAQRYAGQTVDVTVQHGGNTGKTAITLNSRN
jgi:hypothetical protein